jgi:hypothetical protein
VIIQGIFFGNSGHFLMVFWNLRKANEYPGMKDY